MTEELPPPVEPLRFRPSWAVAIVISLAMLAGLAALITWSSGWLHDIWFNYGWASDKGNGPEAIQQTVLYAIIAAILIPAVRRFLRYEFERLHRTIVSGHAELHDKLDAVKALSHHIILHSKDIPNVVPGLAAEHQPQPEEHDD